MPGHRGPQARNQWDDLADAHRWLCGTRLAEARKRSGLSIREIATRAGIGDASLISRYEGGVTPSVARQFALAEALGVTMTELWGWGDDPLSEGD
jgi:transcriptional regulator with XRE-family HTH domain